MKREPLTTPLERMDAAEFARRRLSFEPDERQAEVLDTRIRRGILCCSRQWGKSSVIAAKALHHAAARTGSNVLVVSPSGRQSGEFLTKVREFALAAGYRIKSDGNNRASLALDNGSRIVALPGERAHVRGFSNVTLLIIDEAADVSDAHYQRVRPFLAAVRKGRATLWMMGTPSGKRGFFYRTWEEGGPEWFRLRVTGAETSRISAEFLVEERDSQGELRFRQEYGCEFLEPLDGVFREDDIAGVVDAEVPGLWR